MVSISPACGEEAVRNLHRVGCVSKQVAEVFVDAMCTGLEVRGTVLEHRQLEDVDVSVPLVRQELLQASHCVM